MLGLKLNHVSKSVPCGQPVHAPEQAVDLIVIWYVVTLAWHHCGSIKLFWEVDEDRLTYWGTKFKDIESKVFV